MYVPCMCIFGKKDVCSQFDNVFVYQTVSESRKLVPDSVEAFYYVLNTLQHSNWNKTLGGSAINANVRNIHAFTQQQEEQQWWLSDVAFWKNPERTTVVLVFFAFSFVSKTVVLCSLSSVLETTTKNRQNVHKMLFENSVSKYTHTRYIHFLTLDAKLHKCTLKGPFSGEHQ